jgi:hypothetical protein
MMQKKPRNPTVFRRPIIVRRVKGHQGACGRVGVWACGRVGVWACGRVGVWACGRVGVWAYGRFEARSAVSRRDWTNVAWQFIARKYAQNRTRPVGNGMIVCSR